MTRGCSRSRNDEAELAAVLAHEIGHVARRPHGGRPPANRVAAEAEADRLGLGFLAAAGYDPRAQADLQATLLAAHALGARLRGGGPMPLPARSYAPGLDDRLRASRAAALGGRRDARARRGTSRRSTGWPGVRARPGFASGCTGSGRATTCGARLGDAGRQRPAGALRPAERPPPRREPARRRLVKLVGR